MKGFLKFVGTVAVSVALSWVCAVWWFTSGNGSIRVWNIMVTYPDNDKYTVITPGLLTASDDERGFISLQVCDPGDSLATGPKILLWDQKGQKIEATIRGKMPTVELTREDKYIPHSSLRATGF